MSNDKYLKHKLKRKRKCPSNICKKNNEKYENK